MRHLLLAALVFTACARQEPARKDVVHHPGLANNHVATCTEACGEPENPPLGGPHCGTTSACRVFDAPVPRCLWIHNLEHGHVVLAYKCGDGCPDVVAALTKVRADAHAAGNDRVLVTPDPLLPQRVAAMVWAYGWTGQDFDADAVKAVLALQDIEAPEPNLPCAP